MNDNPTPYFARLVLTHGAGSPVESDFMQQLKEALNKIGVDVRLFNFEYMQRQIETQKKRPPAKLNVLLEEFLLYAKAQTYDLPLFIGGKSMGGRVATHVGCDEHLANRLRGVIVFGYPFHPPGKQDKLRIDHFDKLRVPVFINQGVRDTFGKQEEVEQYQLGNKIELNWLADGDHSFKPRKVSGLTQQDLINQSAQAACQFMRKRLENKGPHNAW